tara:strand:- start:147 stop:860 length:714 start_codon:yes stop_codon:yes gene_type:complete
MLPDKEHRLFIATPAFGFQTYVNYVNSVVSFIAASRPKDLKYSTSFHLHSGGALISHARNDIVDKFLKTDCTKILFIDADIGFEPEDIWRLLRKDVDLALAPYLTKNLSNPNESKFILKFKDKTPDEDGFVKITRGPAGFMMVDRNVFTKMAKAYPEKITYSTQIQDGKLVETKNFPAFFDCITCEEEGALGEDISFCKRWTDIGGEIYCDTIAALSHLGTFRFRGQLGKSLEAGVV